MPRGWRSAHAGRDGGALMIDDDCADAVGSEPAAPANPRTPYAERSVARAPRAKAHDLKQFPMCRCVRSYVSLRAGGDVR
ncbi:hypothetical protein E6R60_30820 [Streptomyces sp. A0642]|nr:hypothetical protein E6R60_30820 [Streptomyces sp. A0642]